MESSTSQTPPAAPPARDIPRAEMVGSLLKPPELEQLFHTVYGDLAQEALVPRDRQAHLAKLHATADAAIADAVQHQIDIGLDVVGDGELRRAYFLNSLYDGVSGLEPMPPEKSSFSIEPYIAERMAKVSNPLAAELAYLRTLTDRPIKASLPAPSVYHLAGYARSPQAYPDAAAFIDHAVEIERAMLDEAIEAGADYVQLDYPIYTTLVDPTAEELVSSAPDDVLAHALRADAAVVADVSPDVTTAIHMCRGNFRSNSLVTGALDSVAEAVFSTLPYDRFLVEWHDETLTGGFEPIRFVPKGKIVVMGLVSTKDGRVESVDELLRKMDEAQRYLPIEQLAISPQCGFASFFEGNEPARDVMWRKLEVVVETADRIWPR